MTVLGLQVSYYPAFRWDPEIDQSIHVPKDHDSLFRAAKQDFERLVEKISDKIIEEIDQTVPELPLKDLVSALSLLYLEPVHEPSIIICKLDYCFSTSCQACRTQVKKQEFSLIVTYHITTNSMSRLGLHFYPTHTLRHTYILLSVLLL